MRHRTPRLVTAPTLGAPRLYAPGRIPGAALFAGMALFSTASAAGLPALELPQGLGVNIHFTRGHQADLDLIAAAGFRFVRMDFSWSSTEPSRGVYDWSAYDELTDNLQQLGLRALYILDYSNGLYEEPAVTRDPLFGRESRSPASPRHPESVAAFARWAAAAARHFQDRSIIWEVWNEPNIGFWKPHPDVQEYLTLLRATLEALRQADPGALIVAPASSEFPWDFLATLLAAPRILDGLDAVSVHPYRSRPPETVAGDYLRLRALIEQLAPPAKRQLPILSGEWGYTCATGAVSPETQAAYLARQQLVNLWQGVPVSIWYDWKNDGTDPQEREHNFGTVTHDLQPKPAYRAAQTLTRELDRYRVLRRLSLNEEQDYVLLLVNPSGGLKLAGWTTGSARRVVLPLDVTGPNTVSITDSQGAPRTPVVQDGRLALDLTPAPQYVTVHRPSRFLTSLTAWDIDPAIPARVKAGPGRRLVVPVRIRNPFDQPIRVEALLAVPPLAPVADRFELSPQATTLWTPSAALERRDRDQLLATIDVHYVTSDDSNTRPLKFLPECRLFVVGNPLLIEIAPAESGPRVTLRNPSGEPFVGELTAPGLSSPVPVRLRERQTELAVSLPDSSASTAGTLRLRQSDGVLVAETELGRWQPLSVPSLVAVLDGDRDVPAHAALVNTNAPGDPDRPASLAYRLDYRFDPGWRFVRCAPSDPLSLPLPAQPSRLGVWIRGNTSRNILRLRLQDEAGQTFQVDGPPLDWTDWRWVVFELTDAGAHSHWGGANDGVVRGGLRVDTLLLVDSTREKTAGTIFFAYPGTATPAHVNPRNP